MDTILTMDVKEFSTADSDGSEWNLLELCEEIRNMFD